MYKKLKFIIIELIVNLRIYINFLKLLINKDLSFPKEWWITKTFEENCKNFLWVKYVLWTNNWTSALHSAFFSISDKIEVTNCLKWKEIICPSYTWWASILPALDLWAKVCFVDINKDTLTISLDSFKKAISSDTIAVLVPHLWWESADIKEIVNISKEKGIYVIEDASHCFWTSIEWKMLWTFWDIWIFSLQANKPISWWEWWLIVTNNKELYERSILIWHYERIKSISWKYLDYKNTWLWFKYRIHPISCLIANYKLKYINLKAKLENEAMDYLEFKLKYLWFKIIRSKKVQRWPQFWYKLIIDCIDIDKKNNFLLLCRKFNIPIEKEYFSQLDKEKVFLEKYYIVDWLDNIREVYNNLYTLTPINFLDKWKINKIIKDLEYILNIL